MNHKKAYAQYLASDAWKALRTQARERAGNKCEFCDGPPNHVHHVRYPKRFKDDHIDNLVVVCEPCHSKLHGIREDIYVDDWVGTAVGLDFCGGEPRIKMVFDPMPEDLWRDTPIKKIAEKYGQEEADEILNQFGDLIFERGESYAPLLSLNHPLLFYGGTNTQELFMRLWEYFGDKSTENPADIGAAILDCFSVGPVSCAFRKK